MDYVPKSRITEEEYLQPDRGLTCIDDPVAWQKDIRTDRAMFANALQ